MNFAVVSLIALLIAILISCTLSLLGHLSHRQVSLAGRRETE